jgi:GTP1/Obg family GTP-binding protein
MTIEVKSDRRVIVTAVFEKTDFNSPEELSQLIISLLEKGAETWPEQIIKMNSMDDVTKTLEQCFQQKKRVYTVWEQPKQEE